MDFYGLCDHVLQEGCGTTLAEVLESDLYVEKLQDQAWLLIDASKDEQSALRAGHLEFGMALNAEGEEAALVQPGYVENCSIESIALIRTIGELILENIWEVCLPGDVKALAEEWKDADADRQAEVAFEVYEKIRDYARKRKDKYDEEEDSEEGSGKKELGKIDFMAYWLDSIFYDQYAAEQVMPLKIKNLEEDGVKPNCLGVALLLLGFAKKTGSPYMLASMFRDSSSFIQDFQRKHVLSWLEEVCKEREIEDESLRKIIDENKAVAEAEAEKLNDFHYSLVIAADDGRWIHLDPYMHNFAVFHEPSDIEGAYKMLSKYSRALPGLSFVLENTSFIEGWLRERWQELKDDMDTSEAFRQSMRQGYMEVTAGLLTDKASGIQDLADIEGESITYYDTDIPWLTEKFEEFCEADDMFNIILQEDVLRKGTNIIPEDTVFYKFDKLAAFAIMMFPGEILEWEDDALVGIDNGDRFDAMYISFLDDEEYRNKFLEKICNMGVYGSVYKNMLYVRNAVDSYPENDIPHAVMEFLNPEYGLALAVLNHVACYRETSFPNDLFLNYTSSQVFWHDAVDLSREEAPQTPLTREFENRIKVLPDIKIHPLCRSKISSLEKEDEQKEGRNGFRQEVPGQEEGAGAQGASRRRRERLLDPVESSQPAGGVGARVSAGQG